VSTRRPEDPIVLAMRCCVLGDRPGADDALERVVRAGRTDELIHRAAEQRVLGALEPLLRTVPGVAPATLDRLLRQATGHVAHQLRIGEELRWFAGIMAEEGVRWLTFKGPAIAQLLYQPAASRAFQDLDLLIPQAEFPRAIDALERRGAQLLDRNWRLIRRERRAQLHVALPLGTEADVHWHVLNRHAIRATFTVDTEGLFERARTVDVDGQAVPTLGPADTLTHLALHAALGGADRLGWFEDVRRSIVFDAASWDEVVERARSWRAGPSVAVTLARARAAIGAEVPDRVLRSLDPSATRRAVGGWIDRRWSTADVHGGRSPAVLWAQLVRDGIGPTARTVGHRVVQPVSGVYRHVAGEPRIDPGSPSAAVFQPAGTEAEQRRYLRAVASGEA